VKITSKNILKSISLLSTILIINGCMPKNADGTYPVTYSYHPYNKHPTQIDSLNQPAKRVEEQPWIHSNAISPKINTILSLAVSQMGKPYKWASTGPDMFDCSGFTTFVYKQNGISLPRTAKAQSEEGERVSYENLKEGDLIFFRSPKSSRVSHTGIYLGKNMFIHASSSKNKVVQSRLDSGYYRENFKLGRRFLK